MRYVIIRITGRVQGVFFRHSAQQNAQQLGLKGVARNEVDGTLTIEVEGDEKNIDQFLVWCKHGPPKALVQNVHYTNGVPRGFTSFEIQ